MSGKLLHSFTQTMSELEYNTKFTNNRTMTKHIHDLPPDSGRHGIQAPLETPIEPISRSHPVYGTYYSGPDAGSPGEGFFGDLSPGHLLRVARRRWLTIALALVFAFGVASFYLRTTPKRYSASALVEMSVRRPRLMRQEGAVIEDRFSFRNTEDIFNTRLERFRSPDMRVLAFEHLDRTADDDGRFPDRAAAMPGASFSLVRNSQMVRITVMGRDPALIAAAANAYARATETSMEIENRESSEMAVAWLQDQARTQRIAVDRADRELVDLRENIGLDSLATRAELASAATRSVGATLANVQSKILLNRELLKAVDNAELTPESIERLPREAPFVDVIMRALDRLELARMERDGLRASHTERHPEYIAADQAVDDARKHAVTALRQARETVQADVHLYEQQAAELEQRVAQLDTQSSTLEIELARARASIEALQRQREAADMSYRGLLSRIEEARLSADEYTAAIKLIRQAQPPSFPIHPSRRRVIQLALLFGLAAGGLLALVKDNLEDLMDHAEDAERQFGLKVLSIVPQIRKMERADIAKLCAKDKHSHFAESFAGLRGLLDSGEYRQHADVLLVASTMHAVGKTICAANLAITFAQRGDRTLLIDFDMRRPQLCHLFKMPTGHASLLKVLNEGDRQQFEALPFHTDIEGLDVVSSRVDGKISASEALGKSTVKAFVDWAKNNYDRVVMDSPPYGIVNDSIVLARLADGILMVLRPGQTRKHSARTAIRHFIGIGAPVLGSVVNGMDFSKARFFSSYDYKYSHYRYGYADHYSEAKKDG